ncbi:MAG: branched-chain amino acid ABC transporter permease [Candidatus Rokuibacteriota bacterium]|nr:MAG: branched-chain amino acid ABC transporter permease [Candidatus Rokubacteria bacterium]
MIYREAGLYRSTYAADMAIFPLPLDRIAVGVVVVAAAGVIPFVASGYLLKGLLIPTLAYALAAIGLNILTGYAGQLSLGHAAFMAVGAYGAVIAYGRYGWPLLASFLVGGLAAAAVGAVVGLPSLRIKGFYLAVTTLAVQYIVEWGITHVRWIGGGVYATIDVPDLALLGVPLDTGPRKYLLCLATVVVLTVFAKNLVRTRVGRAWMAIRDRDVAAEIMGIGLLRYKMLAFVVSSFYAGVAGALISFCFYQAANIEEYTLTISIRVLGMIIIGGMGSILGSYLGAAFVVLLPIAISNAMVAVGRVSGGLVATDVRANAELVIFGGLILFFLIVEPLGLARLWKTLKDYLRLWPFPY